MTAPSLAGPEQALSGHVEPRNDEVIAVFRNGALEDVYAPGRRLRALWRKYRPGALTYARILRADIQFESDVRDVALKDDWTLPSVTVTTFVALNSDDDYAALRSRLDQRGLGFMAALSGELHAEMDAFVRRIVGPMTHDAVVVERTPDGLGHAHRLLGGLFVVDRVLIKSATSDPQYQALQTAMRGIKVDEAENERAAAMAAARGLKLTEYENPEYMAQQHQLELTRLTQSLELERLRAETFRVQVEAEAAIKVASVNNIRSVQSAQRAGIGRDLTSLSALSAREDGPVSDEIIIDATVIDTDALDVTRDGRVVSTWAKAGGARALLRGAVRVEDEAGSLVVLVVRGDSQFDLVADLAERAFPGDGVVVLSEAADLDTWVRTLVAERAPSLTRPGVRVECGADVVVLRVTAPSTPVIKAITKPGALVTEALGELLAREIECTPVRS